MIKRIKEYFFGEPLVKIDAKGGFYKMRYIVVYPNELETWEAVCPSLPGIHVFGKTKEDAINEARTAIGEYVDEHWHDINTELPRNVRPEVVMV